MPSQQVIPKKNFRFWRRNSSNSLHKVQPVETAPMNDRSAQALHYMSEDCPSEVLPLILAFCGPQQTSALSRVSKHWNSLVDNEQTFRVFCEELYKWTPDQPKPASWKEYYKQNPCVPVDYRSISKAIATVTESINTPRGRRNSRNNQSNQYQVKSVRVFLRPGTYYLREAIQVKTFHDVNFTIETMTVPETLFIAPVSHENMEISEIAEQPLPPNSSTNPSKRAGVIRSLFSCNKSPSIETSETDVSDMDESFEIGNHTDSAKLVLRTRKANEPVFNICQGGINLKHLNIQHQCPGVDIWNGNAAIQIQPPLGDDGTPLTDIPTPFCHMEHCSISSKSGRGIVNIDGGSLKIQSSMVKDCAATGIYIGGPGSNARIENTDILRNGVGNRMTRRGISRGHSGIYLEQGEAIILDSNVSENTLTGISVVSPDNAVLELRNSSLVANGTYQLELPPPGTRSHHQSVQENNQLEFLGVAPLRSGLLLDA